MRSLNFKLINSRTMGYFCSDTFKFGQELPKLKCIVVIMAMIPNDLIIKHERSN